MPWRNGGVIGQRNLPSAVAASGVWRLSEIESARRGASWPFVGDDLWSSVECLCHFDGANAGTSFIDESSTTKVITRLGSPTIRTDQSQFGGSSGLFNGNNDYLTIAGAAMAVGSSNFTIECWVRMLSFGTGIRSFWGHRASSGVVGGALLTHTGGSIRLYIARNAFSWQVQDVAPGLTLSLNTWHHVALVRDGSVIRTFLDGVAGGTVSLVESLIHTSGDFSLMAGSAGGTQNLHAYIDDFRFTRAARYTASFSVPAAAFPDPR
jgi:hypothetical protein